jgi:hypothetical protein
MNSAEPYMPEELTKAVRKFVDICRYSQPSRSLIDQVGLFGTFEYEKYTACEIGLKCLFSVLDWGNHGHQAQLFYDVRHSGGINYSFKDFWVAPGYNITRDKELYRGDDS